MFAVEPPGTIVPEVTVLVEAVNPEVIFPSDSEFTVLVSVFEFELSEPDIKSVELLPSESNKDDVSKGFIGELLV